MCATSTKQRRGSRPPEQRPTQTWKLPSTPLSLPMQQQPHLHPPLPLRLKAETLELEGTTMTRTRTEKSWAI